MRVAAAAPCSASTDARLIGSSAEHHPPLRPLAPNPTVSRSTTATRKAGSRCRRCNAVHSPVSPPPTIATSTSRSRSRAGKVIRSCSGNVSAHTERPFVDVVPAIGDIALNVGGGGRPQAARVTVRYTTGMSTFPPPTTAPAGWYPDPTNGGTRYFDGRVWAPIQPVFEEREAHPDLPLAAAMGALGVLVASLLVGRTLGSLVANVGARRDRVRARRRDRLRALGDVGVVCHASLGRRQPIGRRLQISMDRSRLGTADVAVGGGQPTRDVRGGGAVPHPDHQQRRGRVRSRRHARSTRWRRCWRRSSRHRWSKSSCSAGW